MAPPTPPKKRPPRPSVVKRALREARFVAEYLKDQNGTRAAIAAGYTKNPNAAHVQASRLLQKSTVRRALGHLVERQLKKAELTAELVLEAIRRHVAAAAYGDKRRLFDVHGNSKPIHLLTRDESDLIAGYEVILKNAKAGDGVTDEVLKLKLNTFEKYVEMGAKYFGLLEERVRVSGDDELIALLQSARARADKDENA